MDNLAVSMQGITKIFNGVKANDNVDFNLRKGSIHGLLGENGAGKTTLMNILYGLYQQEAGDIYINGSKEEISSPIKAISLGIGMVHQHFMLARPMTVVENVMLGKKSRRGILLDTKETATELKELADKYKMNIDPYSKIWQLSVGEQQRVEILTAIYQGADILILDEPTAVLTPQEANILFDMLRHMKADGKSIILITHKLEEIISIVDEVTVLRDGELIGSKLVDEHTTKEELTKMMVGRDVLFNFDKNQKAPGAVKVELKGLSASNDKGLPALTDFNLTVHEGEILGLAGVDGNGQKELCEVLTGLRKADGGQFLFKGKEVINQPPVFYINSGISHIPEDRMTTGLALNWSLKKNLIIKKFHKAPFSKNGLLNQKAIDAYWDKCQKEYQIKANSGEDHARALSGGNQQKVIFGKWLERSPSVFMMDDPTRGIDVGAKYEIYELIINMAKQGKTIIVVSSEMPEILGITNRIGVMSNGRLAGIVNTKETDQEELLRLSAMYL